MAPPSEKGPSFGDDMITIVGSNEPTLVGIFVIMVSKPCEKIDRCEVGLIIRQLATLKKEGMLDLTASMMNGIVLTSESSAEIVERLRALLPPNQEEEKLAMMESPSLIASAA